MDSMRAIVQHSFGGPEVLEVACRPVPEPLPTEVRVRVEASRKRLTTVLPRKLPSFFSGLP